MLVFAPPTLAQVTVLRSLSCWGWFGNRNFIGFWPLLAAPDFPGALRRDSVVRLGVP